MNHDTAAGHLPYHTSNLVQNTLDRPVCNILSCAKHPITFNPHSHEHTDMSAQGPRLCTGARLLDEQLLHVHALVGLEPLLRSHQVDHDMMHGARPHHRLRPRCPAFTGLPARLLAFFNKNDINVINSLQKVYSGCKADKCTSFETLPAACLCHVTNGMVALVCKGTLKALKTLHSHVFQSSHMCTAELTCWYLYDQHNAILGRISKHF